LISVFAHASIVFQFRDLRAKAATDLESSERAQKLLGHSTVTTTEGHIRGRRGDRVMPLERGITDKTVELQIRKNPLAGALVETWLTGGEGGIRTHDTLPYT
jgi:hypothetical protein